MLFAMTYIYSFMRLFVCCDAEQPILCAGYSLLLRPREIPIQFLKFNDQLARKTINHDAVIPKKPLSFAADRRVRVQHPDHHTLDPSLNKPTGARDFGVVTSGARLQSGVDGRAGDDLFGQLLFQCGILGVFAYSLFPTIGGRHQLPVLDNHGADLRVGAPNLANALSRLFDGQLHELAVVARCG
jgi:hypothetical protein